jgi:hypothetical protein
MCSGFSPAFEVPREKPERSVAQVFLMSKAEGVEAVFFLEHYFFS